MMKERGETMPNTPVTIFDLSYGDHGEAEQLEASRTKCVRMFAGWRARLGVDDDAPAQKSYAFPTRDTIDIRSATSAEVIVVHTADDGTRQEYLLDSDGALTVAGSDLAPTWSDYEACSRSLFDATNYQWADGHEIA